MGGPLDKSLRPTGSGRRIAWSLLAVGALVCLSFAIRNAHNPGPRGRTLTDLFNDPELGQISLWDGMPGGPGTPSGPAFQAFLDADTQALPFLAEVARQRPNWLSRGYTALHQHLPAVLAKRLPSAHDDAYHQGRQVRALTLIGTIGYWHSRPRSWGSTNSPFPAKAIQSTLARCFSDPCPRVRSTAADAAACMPEQTFPLVPALIGLLSDRDGPVRFAAITSLGCFGHLADSAVNPLQAFLLNGPSEPERLQTIEALGQIGPAAAPTLPAVVAGLESTNVWLQRAAALTVFQIGQTPPEAVPALSRCTNAPTQIQLRQCAALALWNAAPADPTLVAAVSNAFCDSPVLGVYHLRSGHATASVSNLVPMLRHLAQQGDPPTRRMVERTLLALQPPATNLAAPISPSPFSPEAAL